MNRERSSTDDSLREAGSLRESSSLHNGTESGTSEGSERDDASISSSEQQSMQSPLSVQPPLSDAADSATTSTTATTPSSAKKPHKGLNVAGIVIPNFPVPGFPAKPAGPDAVSGATGLVAGIKATKKVEVSANVITYYPVAISDGTANHRTFSFPSNRMRTTKYTPVSFIFKLLYEQYKKATNVCNNTLSLILMVSMFFILFLVSCTDLLLIPHDHHTDS